MLFNNNASPDTCCAEHSLHIYMHIHVWYLPQPRFFDIYHVNFIPSTLIEFTFHPTKVLSTRQLFVLHWQVYIISLHKSKNIFPFRGRYDLSSRGKYNFLSRHKYISLSSGRYIFLEACKSFLPEASTSFEREVHLPFLKQKYRFVHMQTTLPLSRGKYIFLFTGNHVCFLSTGKYIFLFSGK